MSQLTLPWFPICHYPTGTSVTAYVTKVSHGSLPNRHFVTAYVTMVSHTPLPNRHFVTAYVTKVPHTPLPNRHYVTAYVTMILHMPLPNRHYVTAYVTMVCHCVYTIHQALCHSLHYHGHASFSSWPYVFSHTRTITDRFHVTMVTETTLISSQYHTIRDLSSH